MQAHSIPLPVAVMGGSWAWRGFILIVSVGPARTDETAAKEAASTANEGILGCVVMSVARRGTWVLEKGFGGSEGLQK